nr:PQQ-binding-like beta-propeller repeat protein [Chloroflexota bacterium]
LQLGTSQSTVWFEAHSETAGDAAACLANAEAEIAAETPVNSMTPAAALTAPNLPAPGPSSISALELTLDSGANAQAITFLACLPVADDATLELTWFVGDPYYEFELPRVNDLLATLLLPGSSSTEIDVPSTEVMSSFRGNPARSGAQPGPAPDDAPELLWTFSTGDDFAGASSPAVTDTMVYTGSNALYAIDRQTGIEVWSIVRNVGFVAPPVVVDGVLYAAGEDGTLSALEPATGAIIWEFAVELPITSSPAIANGLAYVGGWDGNIYAVDITTGELAWSARAGGTIFQSVAVNEHIAVAGTDAGLVVAFDALTGAPVWDTTVGTGFLYTPTIDVTGSVYAVTGGGSLFVIDGATGELSWSSSIGAPTRSPVAVINGIVYVGTDAGKLLAFEVMTGTGLWGAQAGVANVGPPVVVAGVVFVGNDVGFSAFDASTGATLWSVELPGGAQGSAAIVDGEIFVASPNGDLYALGAIGTPLTDAPTSVGSASPTTEASTYTSDLYDFSLTYDPGVWGQAEGVFGGAEGDTEYVNIGNETINVYLVGDSAHDGNAQVCFDAAVERQRGLSGVTDFKPATDGAGVLLAGATGTTNVWGVFTFLANGNERAVYFECYALTPGGTTLEISAFLPLDQYNELIAELQVLLAGLELL